MRWTAAPAVGLLGLALAGAPASASRSTKLAPRIAALARSSAGRSAQAQWGRAITNPALARATKTLLKQYKGSLTPFGTNLLKLDVLAGDPRLRAALVEAAAGKPLTRAQAKFLRRLNANPAVARLAAKGRALKAHPSQLAADWGLLAGAPSLDRVTAVATGDADFDAVDAGLAGAMHSPAVQTFQAKMRQLLHSSAALAYVKTLPPLVVASLIPEAQLRPLVLRTPDAVAARRLEGASGLSPTESATLQLVVDLGKLLPGGLGHLDPDVPNAQDVAGAMTFVGDGEQIATDAFNLAQTLFPPVLTLSAPRTAITAGESLTYTLTGKTDAGVVVPVSGASLTMMPDGYCLGYTCTTTFAGNHSVVAVHGAERTVTTLGVIAGPLDVIGLSPLNASVPLGYSETYGLRGFDSYGNAVPVTAGDGPGEATLTMTDGVCIGDTCIPKALGDQTVTARAGSVVNYAYLTVTSPDHLTLSPATASIGAGGSQPYAVEGFDAAGRDLGPLHGATLAISPDGSCTERACTANVPGTHTVTATIGTATGEAHLTVQAGGALAIATRSLGAAWAGTPYSGTFAATGGQGPYTWQIIGGSLPDGFTLDSATGAVSGELPSPSGCVMCDTTVYLTVKVTDAAGQTVIAQRVPLLAAGTPPPCSSDCAYQIALWPGHVPPPDTTTYTTVTTPAYVPSICWTPHAGDTFPDGNPRSYEDRCYQATYTLYPDGSERSAYGFAASDGLLHYVEDGQDPSTIHSPFSLGPACQAACAGARTWLELWFIPDFNTADWSLLAMSTELTLTGGFEPFSRP